MPRKPDHRQGRAVPARPFFHGRHFKPAGTWFASLASLAPRSPLSVAGCAANGHSVFIPRHSLARSQSSRAASAPGFPLPRSAPSTLRVSAGEDNRVIFDLRCRHVASHLGLCRRHHHQGSTPSLCLHFRSTLASVLLALPSSVLVDRVIDTFDRSRFTPARSFAAAAPACRSRRQRFPLRLHSWIFRL